MFRLPSDTVKVVPDGVHSDFRAVDDRARTRQVLASYGAEHGRLLLYVGGISPHKNLATLLEAYARVVLEWTR